MSERLLLLILRLNAVMLVLAFPAVIMPYEWMNAIHQWLGLGVLPDIPIMGYLTRSISLLYGMFGILTFVIAADPKRYWHLIGWWGLASLGSGFVLGVVDVVHRMPTYWTLSEASYLVCLGIVVLILWYRARGTTNASMKETAHL